MKKRYIAAVIMLLLLASLSPSFGAENSNEAESASAHSDLIAPGSRLTLEQCIDIAVKHSPDIAAADAAVRAAEGRLGQARSGYFPQFSLSAGYTKYSPASDPSNNSFDQYTAGATLTQTIWDFGRTPGRVRVERMNKEAAYADRRGSQNLLIYNVKEAYYKLVQAIKNREVAAETVKLNQEQLDQAKGFFDAGVKSRYDVTSAEVNLSNARLSLIRAENAVRLAKVSLYKAMGVPDVPDFAIEDALDFQKSTLTFDEALNRAYENRSDLQSLRAKREAAEAALSLARSGHYPVLSGSANYTRTDTDYPPQASGWSAGVTLTLPIFDGLQTTNRVREARENLNILKANEESLRQNVLLGVQKAYLTLQEIEESVEVAELAVRQAQENYDIANGRYNAGVGNPLDVSTALVGLVNAKTNYIAALANHLIAEAALRLAMGER